jgi:hypothetical protein
MNVIITRFLSGESSLTKDHLQRRSIPELQLYTDGWVHKVKDNYKRNKDITERSDDIEEGEIRLFDFFSILVKDIRIKNYVIFQCIPLILANTIHSTSK